MLLLGRTLTFVVEPNGRLSNVWRKTTKNLRPTCSQSSGLAVFGERLGEVQVHGHWCGIVDHSFLGRRGNPMLIQFAWFCMWLFLGQLVCRGRSRSKRFLNLSCRIFTKHIFCQGREMHAVKVSKKGQRDRAFRGNADVAAQVILSSWSCFLLASIQRPPFELTVFFLEAFRLIRYRLRLSLSSMLILIMSRNRRDLMRDFWLLFRGQEGVKRASLESRLGSSLFVGRGAHSPNRRIPRSVRRGAGLGGADRRGDLIKSRETAP